MHVVKCVLVSDSDVWSVNSISCACVSGIKRVVISAKVRVFLSGTWL